jgi:CHAT domain-containing protein/tetratricopeptide (TPR) repeat protein
MIKLYPIILFTFFLNFNLYSQNCEELQKKTASLFSKGEYNEALKFAENAVTVCTKEFGYESAQHISSLNTLAVIFHQTSNYANADSAYKQCLSIIKKLVGEENQYYATTLNSLAELYFQMGNYSKAEPLQNHVIQIRKKVLGEENIDYAESINNLARLHLQMGKYIEAEPLLIQAQIIYKKVLGEENITYSTLLNDISVLYSNMGDYKKAILLQTQAIEITKNIFGENDYKYAKSLRNLAQIYLTSGDYTKADELNTKSLDIIKKQKKENNDYVFNLNIIADQYYRMGKLAKAEELYIEALDIRKKSVGEEHLDYVTSLSLLASHYNKIGKYDKSESLYIKSLNITKRIVGEENMIYIRLLNNLANLYNNLKDYSRAENIYNQAIVLTKNILGDNNLDYATYLNNLASLYTQLGNYSKAESLMLKSHSIIKSILGQSDFNYAISLNNLGSLYHRLNNYSKAEELFLESLSVTKNIFGENHPNFALTLDNLASLYDDLGDYTKAETLHIKSISIRKKYLGDAHPLYAQSLGNLAKCYELNNNLKLANIQYASSIRLIKNIWLTNLGFLSSNEADKFINSNEFEFDSRLSFLSRHPQESVKSELFDFNILKKNILFNTNHLFEKTVENLKDTPIKLKWKYYKEISLQFNKQIQFSTVDQKILSELKRKKDSVEKQLLVSLPDFKVMLSNNQITWNEIKNKMKPNEVVLDFVHFRYRNSEWTDSIIYSVFILRKEWKEPHFINLFSEEQLASLFDSSNKSYSINNLYCDTYKIPDSNCNSNLYNLIWYPIDSFLKEVKKVFISPSGLLNRVSFSAITTPEGGRLIDHYSIEQLSNIRTIAETNESQRDSIKSMALIGGANFDVEPSFSNRSNINYVSTDTLFSAIRSLQGSKWSYLAGTENEVSAIKNIASPNKTSVSLLTGGNASEENFKKIGSANVPAPSVIHIATHGFAFATPKKIPKEDRFLLQDNRNNIFRMSEDPLTRAGLVMAGGNKVWSTGLPYPNHEDGILTAREVSEMNLKGCVLATLSACETGLGEIKGSEGVFGLQRAFKMAGVKYLIVSLWKVPDAQTKEFMELFYSSWLNQKLTIREAFRQTQISMSKKYPPYQWAAFVLME